MTTPGEVLAPLSAEERAAYRETVRVLLEACLAGVRGYPLPEDAEPAMGTSLDVE